MRVRLAPHRRARVELPELELVLVQLRLALLRIKSQ